MIKIGNICGEKVYQKSSEKSVFKASRTRLIIFIFSYIFAKFDDFSKCTEGAAKLRKIIKKLAKNEEKPCSTCL